MLPDQSSLLSPTLLLQEAMASPGRVIRGVCEAEFRPHCADKRGALSSASFEVGIGPAVMYALTDQLSIYLGDVKERHHASFIKKTGDCVAMFPESSQ